MGVFLRTAAPATAIVLLLSACPPGGAASNDDVEELRARLTLLESELESRAARIDDLEAKTAAMEADSSAVRFVGVDVYIQDGSGTTMGAEGGSGNLILGYDEGNSDRKTGSHNLVLGELNAYKGAASIVTGEGNEVGDRSYVLGGVGGLVLDGVLLGSINGKAERGGVVVGGNGNDSTAIGAVVVGGGFNEARGEHSVILGGEESTTTADYEIKP